MEVWLPCWLTQSFWLGFAKDFIALSISNLIFDGLLISVRKDVGFNRGSADNIISLDSPQPRKPNIDEIALVPFFWNPDDCSAQRLALCFVNSFGPAKPHRKADPLLC